jgi:hypothetical protein
MMVNSEPFDLISWKKWEHSIAVLGITGPPNVETQVAGWRGKDCGKHHTLQSLSCCYFLKILLVVLMMHVS